MIVAWGRDSDKAHLICSQLALCEFQHAIARCGMGLIPGMGDPFKIDDSVVSLVEVDVIHLESRARSAWQERFSDQRVDVLPLFASRNVGKCDLHIPLSASETNQHLLPSVAVDVARVRNGVEALPADDWYPSLHSKALYA